MDATPGRCPLCTGELDGGRCTRCGASWSGGLLMAGADDRRLVPTGGGQWSRAGDPAGGGGEGAERADSGRPGGTDAGGAAQAAADGWSSPSGDAGGAAHAVADGWSSPSGDAGGAAHAVADGWPGHRGDAGGVTGSAPAASGPPGTPATGIATARPDDGAPAGAATTPDDAPPPHRSRRRMLAAGVVVAVVAAVVAVGATTTGGHPRPLPAATAVGAGTATTVLVSVRPGGTALSLVDVADGTHRTSATTTIASPSGLPITTLGAVPGWVAFGDGTDGWLVRVRRATTTLAPGANRAALQRTYGGFPPGGMVAFGPVTTVLAGAGQLWVVRPGPPRHNMSDPPLETFAVAPGSIRYGSVPAIVPHGAVPVAVEAPGVLILRTASGALDLWQPGTGHTPTPVAAPPVVLGAPSPDGHSRGVDQADPNAHYVATNTPSPPVLLVGGAGTVVRTQCLRSTSTCLVDWAPPTAGGGPEGAQDVTAPASAAVAPDGQEMVLLTRSGTVDLITLTAPLGTGLATVGQGAVAAVAPAWSVDGSWVFFSASRDGRRSVVALGPGGRTVPLPFAGGPVGLLAAA